MKTWISFERSAATSAGGLPLRAGNRAILKRLGTVVYLKADVAELVKRLEKDNTRPLLAGGSLEEKINRLISERSEFYEEAADLEVDTSAGAETVAEVSGASASDSKAAAAEMKERSFRSMYEKIMSETWREPKRRF